MSGWNMPSTCLSFFLREPNGYICDWSWHGKDSRQILQLSTSFVRTTCVPTQTEQLICGQMRPGWVWSGICSNFTASQLDKLLMDIVIHQSSWPNPHEIVGYHLYAQLLQTRVPVEELNHLIKLSSMSMSSLLAKEKSKPTKGEKTLIRD